MLSIDCQKTTENICRFIKTTLRKTGFNKLIIGLSGGVDSATTAFLATKALGKEDIYITLLPYGKQNSSDLKDSQLVIEKLKIHQKNVFLINIRNPVDQIASFDKKIDKIRKGNIIARIRMIYLFDLAKKYKALVCGTENKTEYLLGYYTRFGDEASDIEPIRHLYKTQVYQLAKYLGVPEKIIQKKPTAGLWPGQTDEKELGFSYQEADQILYLYFDKKLLPKEVIKYWIKLTTVRKILSWAKKNKFKHDVPYSLNE